MKFYLYFIILFLVATNNMLAGNGVIRGKKVEVKNVQELKIGLIDDSDEYYSNMIGGCSSAFWPIGEEPKFGDPKTSKYILLASVTEPNPQKAWVNINGEVIELTLKENNFRYHGKVGKIYKQVYVSKDTTVLVECKATGFGDTHAIYCDSTITITKGNCKKIVKASGASGC